MSYLIFSRKHQYLHVGLFENFYDHHKQNKNNYSKSLISHLAINCIAFFINKYVSYNLQLFLVKKSNLFLPVLVTCNVIFIYNIIFIKYPFVNIQARLTVGIEPTTPGVESKVTANYVNRSGFNMS